MPFNRCVYSSRNAGRCGFANYVQKNFANLTRSCSDYASLLILNGIDRSIHIQGKDYFLSVHIDSPDRLLNSCFCKTNAELLHRLVGIWPRAAPVGAFNPHTIELLPQYARQDLGDYFLKRRLAAPAAPINPVPNNSMLAGSGIATSVGEAPPILNCAASENDKVTGVLAVNVTLAIR